MLTLFLEVEETRTDTDGDGGIGCREERFDRGRSRRPQRSRRSLLCRCARGGDARVARKERFVVASRVGPEIGGRRSDRNGPDRSHDQCQTRPGGQGPGPRGQGPREGTQRDCTIQQSTCDNNNNSNHHKNIVIQG